jgi:hypothetical protein
VVFDDVIGERAQGVELVAVIEHLEGTEAHMAGRHAQKHCPGFDGFAVDLLVGADDAQGARGRDTQAMHRLAAQVFANGRAQHGAAIAGAREGRLAGTLQLQFPARTAAGHDLAEHDGAAVAELRYVMSELMSGVQHRQWLAARQ